MKARKAKFLNFDASRIHGDFRYTSYGNLEIEEDYGPPDGGCQCDESDYCCRCQIFHVLEIKAVKNLEWLVNYICGDETDRILRYCVDRILRIYEVYNPSNWHIAKEGGYYGEERGRVSLEGNINPLESALRSLYLLKTDLEKIKFVLKLEYDYLLEVIEDATSVCICIINPKNIVAAEFMKKCKIDLTNNPYSTYTGITGIGITADDEITDETKIRLIDGYHRLKTHNLNNPNKPVEMIVLKV